MTERCVDNEFSQDIAGALVWTLKIRDVIFGGLHYNVVAGTPIEHDTAGAAPGHASGASLTNAIEAQP